MVRVCQLAAGWALYRDTATNAWGMEGPVPYFVRGARRYNPFDMAGVPEAREVYRTVKGRLDEADDLWHLPGESPDFRALDKAKIGLEVALKRRDRWSDDLKKGAN